MDDNQNDSVDTSSTGATEQTQAAAQQAAPVAQGSDTNTASADTNKLYAIIGYILPFLFFLPLLQESSKNDPFARFHANQQLILLIVWIVAQFVLSNVLYMVLYMAAFAIMSLLNLAILALAIMGIVNAAGGHMKELPVVGKFRLLK